MDLSEKSALRFIVYAILVYVARHFARVTGLDSNACDDGHF